MSTNMLSNGYGLLLLGGRFCFSCFAVFPAFGAFPALLGLSLFSLWAVYLLATVSAWLIRCCSFGFFPTK